jgi:hypothetical protein
MLKKRGEDKERVKNLDERRGGKKGLRMLKKRGEDKERVKNFMSFCPILSTLCSLVVFHNVPHLSCRQRKSGTKSTS